MPRLHPLLLALAIAAAAGAETTPAATTPAATTPAATLTADAIIARNLAAKGGRLRLKGIASARATGRLDLPNGLSAPFVWEWRAPNLVRMEFTTAAGASVQAFDGASAWQTNPLANGGKPERLPKEMSDLFALEADFVGPLLDYAAKGHQVVLVAAAPAATRPQSETPHHLRVTLKTGHILDVHLDPKTFLERQQTMTLDANGQPLQIDVTLADYRTVDGVVLPFLVRSQAVGTTAGQAMTFDTVTLGAKIDPARFRMPAEAAIEDVR